MDFYSSVIILTVLCTGILYLFIRYPALKEFIPFFRQFFSFISYAFSYWGANRHFSKSFDSIAKFATLLDTLNLETLDIDSVSARAHVAEFVKDNYKSLCNTQDASGRAAEAEKLSTGAFILLISNEELRASIKSLLEGEPENIEVVRLTLLCIDIFGLLFDLKDKLSLEYYQHLIYAINKVLLTVRDNGITRKSVKDASAVVFRMYKITLAFKRQQGYTVKEFYGTIQKVLDSFFGG